VGDGDIKDLEGFEGPKKATIKLRLAPGST